MSAGTSWATMARSHGSRAIHFVACGSYLVALFLNLASDGGQDSALFFGPIGFAFTLPVLLWIGKLAALLVNHFRKLGICSRSLIVVAPVLTLTGILALDTFLNHSSVRKFERDIVSPAPLSLRIASVYSYKGFNYRIWAFHFFVESDNFPKLLAMRMYQHELAMNGFDLSHVLDIGGQRPGYPIPPSDFKAIHRYHFHRPTGSRVGYSVTLYGNASQSEFYAQGYAE